VVFSFWFPVIALEPSVFSGQRSVKLKAKYLLGISYNRKWVNISRIGGADDMKNSFWF
jgi:hypothetical protein